MVQVFEIVNCAAYDGSAKLEVGLERERDQFGLYIRQNVLTSISELSRISRRSPWFTSSKACGAACWYTARGMARLMDKIMAVDQGCMD